MCVCRMMAGSWAWRSLTGFRRKIFQPKAFSPKTSPRGFEVYATCKVCYSYNFLRYLIWDRRSHVVFTYLPTHQNVLAKHNWVQKCVFKKFIYVKRWWRIRLYPLLWQFGKRCANISIEMLSWNFFLFWFLTYWFLLLSVNPNKTQSGVLLIFK